MREKAVDFDRGAEELGPFGKEGRDLNLDYVTVRRGTCSIDSDFFKDDDVMKLGQCTLDILNETVEA